jgi:hypothetical protein
MTTKTFELVFETPDRNRGQFVTCSYARTKGGAEIERREDASDKSLHYSWIKSGRRLSDAELARYELTERG